MAEAPKAESVEAAPEKSEAVEEVKPEAVVSASDTSTISGRNRSITLAMALGSPWSSWAFPGSFSGFPAGFSAASPLVSWTGSFWSWPAGGRGP